MIFCSMMAIKSGKDYFIMCVICVEMSCRTLTSPAAERSPGKMEAPGSGCRTDLWWWKPTDNETLKTVNSNCFSVVYNSRKTFCKLIIVLAVTVLWEKAGKVSYSVRSNLRSSHRSEGMDDIWVPDRVLEFENVQNDIVHHRPRSSEERRPHRPSSLTDSPGC